jgi:MFS family permease
MFHVKHNPAFCGWLPSGTYGLTSSGGGRQGSLLERRATMRLWGHAWTGLLATLNGVGLCRFAYTPLIPFMIGAGVVSETGAAYLGAANLAGYLAGAWLAAPFATLIGIGAALRTCFVLSIIGLGACVWQGGFWWYFPWRFLAGGAGAALMVLAPSYLLTEAAPGERGRQGGIIYGGVGAGIALSSLIVPPLAGAGLAWAWGALALGAALTTALTWPRWRRQAVIGPERGRPRLGLAPWLVALAFGMDGIGFVPHNLFWVDFIARDLGLGTALGAFYWLLLGLGAAIGPAVGGAIGDTIGLGRALILAFLVKTFSVLLPGVATAWPALVLSSLVTGALTPGIAALCAARMTELVPPARQTHAWGFATLVFGLFQAIGAYAMAYAFGKLHSYLLLYVAGGGFELLGAIFAIFGLVIAEKGRKRCNFPCAKV